jgi:ABC-type sugar transport system ATPase subunit
VQTAARAAHAHDFIAALPQGYDTPLGEGGARLSVGQKQLIAIARALAGQPRILLLDEATSHIDSETEGRLVQQALAALRGRVTVVAIAHRLSTIRDADEIVVLHHGRMAERGSHVQLMAIEGGLYQRLVQLQQLGAKTTVGARRGAAGAPLIRHWDRRMNETSLCAGTASDGAAGEGFGRITDRAGPMVPARAAGQRWQKRGSAWT